MHYFKNLIRILEKKNHEIAITTRDKEMSLYLLDKYGFNYKCTGKNRPSIIGKALSIIRNDFIIYREAKQFKPDVFISFFTPFAAHVGRLLHKSVIGFNDTENAKISIMLAQPFTNTIVVPTCYLGNIPVDKKIEFNGYFELSYLHPRYFKPDPFVINLLGLKKNEKYVIMRFISWKAGHDIGHSGLSIEMKRRAIKELSKYAKVFITSEKKLPLDLRAYQINIPSERIHDALSFASLYVGEGATMASECAMLGTPAIYVSILNAGTLREQEKYGLIFCYKNQIGVLEKALELLNTPDLKKTWQIRREKMLAEKIDVTAFMVWLVENYPESTKIIKDNPDYQFNFKSADSP